MRGRLRRSPLLIAGPWRMLFLARVASASVAGGPYGPYGVVDAPYGPYGITDPPYGGTPYGGSPYGGGGSSQEETPYFVNQQPESQAWFNNPNCTLKVLFLTYAQPSPEDELYAQGFRFWANWTAEYRFQAGLWLPGRLAACLRVEPYFDTLVPESAGVGLRLPSENQSSNVTLEVLKQTSSQIDGWLAEGIRFVILGVDFEDCSVTRGYLQYVGLHHIALNVKNWFIFRSESSERMWGIASPHYRVLDGFVDLTARSSTRGVCIFSDNFDSLEFEDLVTEARKSYLEMGVLINFEQRDSLVAPRYTMPSLAEIIADAGCDILVALLSYPSRPVILQQELANLRAPLTAQFYWPELNTSLWKDLGRMGEQVFSAADWRPDASLSDPYFGSNLVFAHVYRQWLLETAGEDRDPSVQEAASVAAGVLIVAACHALWSSQTFTSFNEPPPSALGAFGLDPSEGEPNQFSIRIAEVISRFGLEGDSEIFWGVLHFDDAGANVGKQFLTIQYLQDGSTATVHPRKARRAPPILPMDSLESRHGCPPGKKYFNPAGAFASSAWTLPGALCLNCSRLLYQDGFNQTECLDCPAGDISEEGATGCELCQSGRHRQSSQDECTRCQLGSFVGTSGATQCERCPAGTFADRLGESACAACPPGRVAQEPGGKRDCSPCEPGFSTNDLYNQSTCTPCARNSYAEAPASPNCTACPATFGTEDIASSSPSLCLCPPGSYWYKATPDAEPACRTQHCEEALRCSGWSTDAPGGQAGYSVGAPPYPGAEPPYIVLCANTQDCPGNLPPGQCPEGHEDARSCARCKRGYGRHGQSGCTKCKGVEWYVPLLMIFIIACLVGAVLYGLRFTENNVPAESVVKITAVIGIVLTAVQILSVFRFIHIDWPEPIGIFHTWYSTVTHPLEVFSSVGCALSITSAFHDYLLLMGAWPAAALCIFVFFKLAGAFSRSYRTKVTNIHIFQMEGILVLLFYTSISMFSLIPWQCERNPDGTSSVVAYRQVLCWSGDEHAGMIVVSCVAISIFIVGFMSLIAWATYQYPYKVTRPTGVKFLLMFRWIFNRFTPEKHYYGFIYCSRNLLVTVLPVVFVDNIPIQFLLVASILIFGLIFQCWNKPWITDLANKFDAASAVLLILVLIVGSLLINTDASALASIMSVIVGSTFSIFGITFMVALGHNVYLRLRPQKEFSFFLCHHKVAAAVLARWVKIELQLRNQGHVFLDSDELNRLDKLFEVVGYETQNFVVLLTSETLSRIWCAGEITTALRRKLRVIGIACNDYVEPTDDFISNIGKIWTDAQIAEVSRQGVSLEQIQEAFVQFRALPKIKHDRGASFKGQMKLVDVLMARGRGMTIADLSLQFPGTEVASIPEDQAVGLSIPTPNLETPMPPTPAQAATTTTSASSSGRSLAIASRHVRNRAKSVFTLPNVTGHGMDHQRNLIVGNLDDPEAFLVSRVLQVQLQQVLQAGVFVASKKIPEALDQLAKLRPSFFIAVLTAGVLSKPSFAVPLAKVCAWEVPPTLVPVVADARFTFPDAKFWDDLQRGVIVDPKALHDHRVSIAEVLHAYKALFLVISKRFSAHGSEKIQWTEVKEIADLWPLSRAYSSTSSATQKSQD